MRAVEPTRSGKRDIRGFTVAWETFGDPEAPAVLMLPSWQIVYSRIWKLQVPFLSRWRHVITFDPPGNGKSERTTNPSAFEVDRVVDYGVGLLDHLSIDRADVIGFAMGGSYGLWMAARYPERVRRVAPIRATPLEFDHEDFSSFWEKRERYEGWQKFNAHHWRADFDDWLAFLFGNITTVPHSTKQFDDLMSWGRETTPEILISSVGNGAELNPELSLEEMLARVRSPVMLIHGVDDHTPPVSISRQLAEARPDFHSLEMADSGHAPNAGAPVRTNLALAEFLERPTALRRTWRRAMSRQCRILFVSSPIGLGHIPRDLEIARRLREQIPDIEIDWLATHPVTEALERAGEMVHPLSRELSNKSAHWESMASDFDLHCFYAFREMDEIMVHNFMVFLDAVRETPYDLWIGDEAWEVDHFLHENPELKTAPFVFMTDFVGFLPMDRSPGSREAFLTADYNAEIIEHIERYPWVRDRSIYFGDFDDVVPERFGPDLPFIREWMEKHFVPVGHVLTFDPEELDDRAELRSRLGYDLKRSLAVAAVGGTAVGRDLLMKIAGAWPLVRRELPDAECVIVAGPRLDPNALPRQPGVTTLAYVDRLYEHFAAADLALVQGGLTTTMELVATRRPFLYFPLRNHFEQAFHVAHRLDRYNAGARMDYHATSPEDLAQAIIDNIGADVSDYRAVEPGGAERAAREIASVLT